MKIGHPKRKLVFQPSIFRCELLVSRRVISFLSFHLRSHLVPPFSSAHQRSAARLRGMRSPHWVMKSYGQAQWKWQWTSSLSQMSLYMGLKTETLMTQKTIRRFDGKDRAHCGSRILIKECSLFSDHVFFHFFSSIIFDASTNLMLPESGAVPLVISPTASDLPFRCSTCSQPQSCGLYTQNGKRVEIMKGIWDDRLHQGEKNTLT